MWFSQAKGQLFFKNCRVLNPDSPDSNRDREADKPQSSSLKIVGC